MEFKRLSDVEVIAEPSESANVLIEEDGVIKKAPKTAVGGGSTEWDAVIDIANDWLNESNYVFTSGSYADLKAKILAGEKPNILIKYFYNYGDDYYLITNPLWVEVADADTGAIGLWLQKGAEWINIGIQSDGTFVEL